MEHVEYCIELMGIDHVALFDITSYIGDMEYVKGLENPNEAIENAVRWLVRL